MFTFGWVRTATAAATSFVRLFDARIGFTFTEKLFVSTLGKIVSSTIYIYVDHLVILDECLVWSSHGSIRGLITGKFLLFTFTTFVCHVKTYGNCLLAILDSLGTSLELFHNPADLFVSA